MDFFCRTEGCNNYTKDGEKYCTLCKMALNFNQQHVLKQLENYFMEFWPNTPFYLRINYKMVKTSGTSKKKTVIGLDPFLLARCEGKHNDQLDITVIKIKNTLKLLEDACERSNKTWYLAFLIKTGQLNYTVNQQSWLRIQELMPEVKATKIMKDEEILYYFDISKLSCKSKNRPKGCETIRRRLDDNYQQALKFIAKSLKLINLDG